MQLALYNKKAIISKLLFAACLLVAAWWLAINYLNREYLTPALVEKIKLEAEKQLGRQVEFSNLSLNLTAGIEIRDLRLARLPGEEEDLLTSKRIIVGLNLLGALRTRDFAGSISHVTLDTAKLWLGQNRSGAWNFETLIPEGPPGEAAFLGKVVLKKSQIGIAALNQLPEKINLAKGEIAFAKTPLLKLKLNGDWAQFPFAISGIYDLERKASDLKGRTEEISVVSLLSALDQRGLDLSWGEIKGGKVQLDLRIWDSPLATAFNLFGGKVQYQIGGKLKGGHWQAPGLAKPARELAGKFRWDTSSKELVLEHVTTRFDESKIRGAGTIVFGASPLYDLNVEVRGNAKEVFEIYPSWQIPDLKVNAPVRADLTLNGTNQSLRVQGSAQVEGGTIIHPSLVTPIEGIRGQVDFEPNKITLKRLACQWQGGSFTIEEGTLLAPWSLPRGKAKATIHSLPLRGFEGLELEDGSTELTLEEQKVWFEDLTLKMAGGTVKGSLALDLATGTPLWETELEGHNLSIAALATLWEGELPELKGRVSTTIAAAGEGFEAASSRFSADLKADAVNYGQLAFDGVNGTILWDGSAFHLGYLNLLQGPGKLALSGKFNAETMELALTGERLPLAAWSSLLLPDEEIKGDLNVMGQITGSGKEPVVVAQVEVAEGQVRGEKIQQLRGDISYANDVLGTEELTIRSGGAVHKLAGTVTFAEKQILNLSWQLTEERLERVMALAGMEQPLAGRVAGKIQLTGALPQVSAEGMVNVLDGKVGKQAFSRGSFFFKTEEEVYLLERAVLEQNGSRLAAKGKIWPDGALQLTVIAPELDLAALTFIPEEQAALLKGKVAFEGLVGGSLSAPVVMGELASEKMEYGKFIFENLAGSITFEDNILALTAFQLEWLGAKAQAAGELLWQEEPTMNLQLEVKGVPLAETVAFAGWEEGQKSFSGLLDGIFQLTGPLDSPKGEGFFSLKGGKVGKLPLAGKGELVLSQNSLRLHNLDLVQGEGRLQAEGLITSQGLSLDLMGEALDLAIFSELFQQVPPLAGKFSLAAQIVGDYKRPTIEAQLKTDDAKVGGLRLGRVDAELALEDGIIKLDKFQAEQNGGFIAASGVVPLGSGKAKAMGLTAARAGSALALDLEMRQFDLKPLSALSPQLATVSGIGNAQLKITGTLAQPQLHGQVQVQNGTYQHELLGGKLEKLEAGLSFQGEKLVVETLTANLGGGKVAITGELTLAGLTPEAYDLALSMNQVHYRYGKMIDCLLNGKVSLDGSASLPKVGGQVELSKTRIDWVTTEGGAAPPFDLLFDLDINTKDQALFRYATMAELWFTGAVHLGGTLSHPALSGEVNSKRGNFSYFEISFLVDEATAEFSEYRGIMPTVHVKATSRVESYTVYLNLSGPLENLNFALTSRPELSQDEILALLGVKGRIDKLVDTATGEAPLEHLMRDELLRFLDDQFRSQFVTGMERTLEEMLGLDEFRLQPNFLTKGEKMEIRLGKQLSEQAFFSYERTLELSPKETFKLDWRLHPSLELKGQWDQETGSSLSLEAKFRF